MCARITNIFKFAQVYTPLSSSNQVIIYLTRPALASPLVATCATLDWTTTSHHNHHSKYHTVGKLNTSSIAGCVFPRKPFNVIFLPPDHRLERIEPCIHQHGLRLDGKSCIPSKNPQLLLPSSCQLDGYSSMPSHAAQHSRSLYASPPTAHSR
jgi:hypothetical protein